MRIISLEALDSPTPTFQRFSEEADFERTVHCLTSPSAPFRPSPGTFLYTGPQRICRNHFLVQWWLEGNLKHLGFWACGHQSSGRADWFGISKAWCPPSQRVVQLSWSIRPQPNWNLWARLSYALLHLEALSAEAKRPRRGSRHYFKRLINYYSFQIWIKSLRNYLWSKDPGAQSSIRMWIMVYLPSHRSQVQQIRPLVGTFYRSLWSFQYSICKKNLGTFCQTSRGSSTRQDPGRTDLRILC